jgi:hypothetical protein
MDAQSAVPIDGSANLTTRSRRAAALGPARPQRQVVVAAPGALRDRAAPGVLLACEDCGVTLERKRRWAGRPLLCDVCYQRRYAGRPAASGTDREGGACAECGRRGERLHRERATGVRRCAVCYDRARRERYRPTRQRWADATVTREGYEARARAVAARDWLPVPVLQAAIRDAEEALQSQRRLAWLRRRYGPRTLAEYGACLASELLIWALRAVPAGRAFAPGDATPAPDRARLGDDEPACLWCGARPVPTPTRKYCSDACRKAGRAALWEAKPRWGRDRPLDLGPYLRLLESVLAQGGVGGVLELGPDEWRRTEKYRLSLAARRLGLRLAWQGRDRDALGFVLLRPGMEARTQGRDGRGGPVTRAAGSAPAPRSGRS